MLAALWAGGDAGATPIGEMFSRIFRIDVECSSWRRHLGGLWSPGKPGALGQRGRWRSGAGRYTVTRGMGICKKIGFAPASCLFPGTSIFGFGFKLALIGFRVPIGSFSQKTYRFKDARIVKIKQVPYNQRIARRLSGFLAVVRRTVPGVRFHVAHARTSAALLNPGGLLVQTDLTAAAA